MLAQQNDSAYLAFSLGGFLTTSSSDRLRLWPTRNKNEQGLKQELFKLVEQNC